MNELDLELIDTYQFQRLRRIKQTGLVYLVYPGAQHTRFEHSIGTRHLAEKILETLKIYGLEIKREEEELLMISSLLHDIAHLPFSHSLDLISEEEHEKLSREVIASSELKDIVSKYGYSVDDVSKCISGERTPLSSIIRSEIDADRLDYLQRDAYYCGVAYGVIDSRILMEFRFHENRVAVSEKGIKPVESVLFARYSMYNMVYGHKTARIASRMLTKGVEEAIKQGALSFDLLLKLGDEELLAEMGKIKGLPSEMSERIKNRKLYKRAFYVSWDEADQDILKKAITEEGRKSLSEKLEDEIAAQAGLGYGEVLVDVPKLPILEEANVKVVIQGKLVDLRRISLLAEPITSSMKRSWSIGVYSKSEDVEKVKRASEKVLRYR